MTRLLDDESQRWRVLLALVTVKLARALWPTAALLRRERALLDLLRREDAGPPRAARTCALCGAWSDTGAPITHAARCTRALEPMRDGGPWAEDTIEACPTRHGRVAREREETAPGEWRARCLDCGALFIVQRHTTGEPLFQTETGGFTYARRREEA